MPIGLTGLRADNRKIRWSMWAAVKVVAVALFVAAAIVVVGLVYVTSTGLRAQPEPGPIETRLARAVRGLAIPREIKTRGNPLRASPEAINRGLDIS